MFTKRDFVLLCSLSLAIASVFAQTPTATANQQLRTLFESIPHPINVNFCYDMACHFIDSVYYDVECKTETNADVWYYLYEEMYNAAFDTTGLLVADTIVSYSNQYFCDTIPIGVIDWRYVHFPEDILSLHLDEHYICDENVGKLYGLDDDMSLLKTSEVFMASPLLLSTRTLHPTFLIDFRFFFTDAEVTQNQTYWDGRIDFGDGAGWRYVTANTAITIDYPQPGEYQIQVYTMQDGVEKYSTSTLQVYGTDDAQIPSYTENEADINGLRIFRFDPDCDVLEDKLIFILAGYNPKSFVNYGIRTPDELYQKYIVNGHLEPLRDFGYSFIIVDYVDHNDYIEQNAKYVARLLSYYRCHQRGDEQFVVIGHSMGCLVGRYALTFLEKNPSAYSDCKYEKLHNTRLFISNDGPHQGVNIPLSLQCFYRDVLEDSPVIKCVTENLSAITRGSLNLSTTLLRGNSVKQMLYYHYSTDPLYKGTYSAHALHTKFLNDLEQLGDYPEYCKLVALSNGSMRGYGQQNYYSKSYAGAYRQEGDHLLLANAEVGVTILGMRFDHTYTIDLLSNNSSNSLGYVQAESSFGLVGLFSGRIYFRSKKTTSYTDYQNNTYLIPYCISAAGNEYVYNFGLDVNFQPLNIWADIFPAWGFAEGQGPGYFQLDLRIGTPWSFNIHGGLGFYSDGLGFGFVPTQSAFDYRGSDAVNIDYTTLDIVEMFQNTKFDALIGRMPGVKSDGTNAYNFVNFNHEDINNQPIPNRRISYIEEDHDSKEKASHYVVTDSVSRLLAREIGDEELYLNNAYLPYYHDKYKTTYDAALSIYVQRIFANDETRNPYYLTVNYDGKFIDYNNELHTYAIAGSYAREAIWDCDAQAIPVFRYYEKLWIDDDSFLYEENQEAVNTCINNTKKSVPYRSTEPEGQVQNQLEQIQSEYFYLYTIEGKYIGKYNKNSVMSLHGMYIATPVIGNLSVKSLLLVF